jgi:hypothetical protein
MSIFGILISRLRHPDVYSSPWPPHYQARAGRALLADQTYIVSLQLRSSFRAATPQL